MGRSLMPIESAAKMVSQLAPDPLPGTPLPAVSDARLRALTEHALEIITRPYGSGA